MTSQRQPLLDQANRKTRYRSDLFGIWAWPSRNRKRRIYTRSRRTLRNFTGRPSKNIPTPPTRIRRRLVLANLEKAC